jgi:hypothetical protein
MKTLVVISKYNEDVSWTEKIIHDVLIYDKSNSPIPNSIGRPNVGRESETLLNYIITHYNNLPDITIFLQGDPRSNPVMYTYDEVLEQINKNHEPKLNTILTWEADMDVSTYWLKSCKVLNDILFDSDDRIKFSSGVQFVIPKKNILCRPLSLYLMLHEEIIKYGNKHLNFKKTNLNDGIDAWTLEVVWGNILRPEKKLKYGN